MQLLAILQLDDFENPFHLYYLQRGRSESAFQDYKRRLGFQQGNTDSVGNKKASQAARKTVYGSKK